MTRRRLGALTGLVTILAGIAYADTTPQAIRVQGYLSDRAGGDPVPADGPHSMTFTLYDHPLTGALIATVGPLEVDVHGGFYEVDVAFAALHFDGSQRFVEIMVEGETLLPRVQLASAPYAYMAEYLDGADAADLEESPDIADLQVQIDELRSTAGDADTLDGFDASYFVDTSSTPQTKAGPLTAEAAPGTGSFGVTGLGPSAGGYFANTEVSSSAWLGQLNYGILAVGPIGGGRFDAPDGDGWAALGVTGGGGIIAHGSHAAGEFHAVGGSGSATVASGDIGIEATGTEAGGHFNTVGVGTASPSVELEVVGDLKASGVIDSTSGGFRFPNGTLQRSARPDPACFDYDNRFVDCGNGAVTDTVTGLIWLQSADCDGTKDWVEANQWAAALADGQCGLTDGSSAGDWRLPTRDEWQLIADQAVANGCGDPTFPDDSGSGCCGADTCPFTGIASGSYYSSTTGTPAHNGWNVWLFNGFVYETNKPNAAHAWPVRGGR